MQVHWTQNSVNHLSGIYEYISLNSHTYAKNMVDRITRRSEQIGIQPISGRMVLEYYQDDIREVIEKPYRIIYRIKPDQIDVLAVVHSARLLENAL